jgi:hypothetical protein
MYGAAGCGAWIWLGAAFAGLVCLASVAALVAIVVVLIRQTRPA